ncbi:MAG: T9SS type A sorting domain-containing protein, partial [Flavobacteriales bacterium]|nr:T9SS type A sorting domain-containing protein [Flavobacteriales bacterium]
IQLTNNLGVVVQQFKIDEKGVLTKNIALEGLNNGIFFIKISNSKEDITKKIVKL